MMPLLAQAQDDLPDDGCPDRVPRIAVVTDIEDYVYDHSRSIAELGKLKPSAQTGSGHLLGLTRQQFESGGDTTEPLLLPQEDGHICVGHTDGVLVLRLRTFIFVAREVSPGSCLYEQVLAHEQRHAKVGQRLYEEFAAKLEAAINEELAKQPFIRVADPLSAIAVARSRLQDIFNPLLRDFRSVYRKRQAIIDTTGEFDRVEATCPGEAGRLIRQ